MKRTLAIAIALLGILLLLKAVGLMSEAVSQVISVYWPGLFILWGLEEFFTHLLRGKRKVLWPALLTFLGLALLLQNLHVPGISVINPWLLFLALFLIYIGVSSLLGISTVRIVVNSKKRRWNEYLKKNVKYDFSSHVDFDDPANYQENIHERVNSKLSRIPKIGDFRVGDGPWTLEPLFLKQLAGSVRINLGTAIIPDGITPIEINGGAGEVRIAVPEGLAVNIRVELFAGEIRVYDQKTEGVSIPEYNYISPEYSEADKKVDIFIRLKAGEVRITRVI